LRVVCVGFGCEAGADGLVTGCVEALGAAEGLGAPTEPPDGAVDPVGSDPPLDPGAVPSVPEGTVTDGRVAGFRSTAACTSPTSARHGLAGFIP
jgi:hypothetical protein